MKPAGELSGYRKHAGFREFFAIQHFDVPFACAEISVAFWVFDNMPTADAVVVKLSVHN
jgi:hypothetical protein